MIDSFLAILMAASVIGMWREPRWFWPVAVSYFILHCVLEIAVFIINKLKEDLEEVI